MSSDLCTAAMSSSPSGVDGAISCSSKEERESAEEDLDEIERMLGEASLEEDEHEEGKVGQGIDLGPRISIKDHLEKDKDDESLRRWKEQLLGSVDLNSVGETLEPDVAITSVSILSPGRPDIFLPLPVEPSSSKGVWFTLREGSNNIVSGLRYTNTVWKTGIKVDSSKEMLGTFSPQKESYTYVTPEETTPSGMFARGSYSARTKFLDDDRKCYLEINYSFDIRREWPSS